MRKTSAAIIDRNRKNLQTTDFDIDTDEDKKLRSSLIWMKGRKFLQLMREKPYLLIFYGAVILSFGYLGKLAITLFNENRYPASFGGGGSPNVMVSENRNVSDCNSRYPNEPIAESRCVQCVSMCNVSLTHSGSTAQQAQITPDAYNVSRSDCLSMLPNCDVASAAAEPNLNNHSVIDN